MHEDAPAQDQHRDRDPPHLGDTSVVDQIVSVVTVVGAAVAVAATAAVERGTGRTTMIKILDLGAVEAGVEATVLKNADAGGVEVAVTVAVVAVV